MDTKFEWDAAKERVNRRKHGLGFELAARVFSDPFAVFEQDRFENGEYRWRALGIADNHLLLLVVHTVRNETDGSEVIRIISARRAEPKERRHYEQNRPL